jgi:transposase
MARAPYPSDINDEEWAFVASYLILMTEDAPQREHSLREVFNGLRWIVRAGAAWRLMPHDLPPWYTVEFIPLSFWYDAPLTSPYSDRRHDPWQVYGSPSCSPVRWRSWISRA